MEVYVLGLATHPPAECIADKRLEEMVFDTARAALDDARLTRDEIDHVTIAGCDELDGRSISSMLLSAPAGAYLRDEIKCADSGLTGLCLGAMRAASEILDVGLVVSWSKSSKAPVEDVMRMRCEPFFTRPIGLNMAISDGLFAQATSAEFGFGDDELCEAVIRAYQRASRNPRGMQRPVPERPDIENSAFIATPLRRAHCAPLTDGAVAIALASGRWLARRPHIEPLARIAGLGWRNAGYSLGRERLSGMTAFRDAVQDALGKAGVSGPGQLDVIELDSQTAYYALAFERSLAGANPQAFSPSGGPFAQNPYFCTGLVNAVEAVLQVSGRAGPVQVQGARRAAAHGMHGFAQQGNVVAIFEGA
jgi:acetyl-CoA acetyltransferase